MAETSSIEWCDSTFNAWIGCTPVSPACDDCYAARSTPARTLGIAWGPGEPRHRTSDGVWAAPKRWNAQHEQFYAEHGRRRRVFCASLADVFDNEVPASWRDELVGLIVDTPHLDWLLLTKRIGNVPKMLKPEAWQHLQHVWLGATVVNQAEADRDVPKLLQVPARVRFLSVEPMLGPVDLSALIGPVCDRGSAPGPGGYGGVTCTRCDGLRTQGGCPGIDWLICGGESGPKARPMHPDWARSLRDQCLAAGVPFLFKQWGEWAPAEAIDDNDERDLAQRWIARDGREVNPDHGVDFFGGDTPVYRAGKRAGGRVLDGMTHDGFPR